MAVEELQSVIKRCQILEEQDFKEEDFGLFQLAGQRCIDEGHIDQLLEIIQNEKNKVSKKSFSTMGKDLFRIRNNFFLDPVLALLPDFVSLDSLRKERQSCFQEHTLHL
uniref:Glomulin, FKBP associated protein n=1 Tax=Rousettus aegyptiacus TaxID=9407 RepID=A0A7J8K907_ROUAE|nr:glomulin, FKBP associated protein [Rousettus aegyptiacus]